MNDAPELKPCPFCGGDAAYSNPERLDEGDECLLGAEVISCDDCCAEVNSFSHDDIFEAWNTRTDLSTPEVKADVTVKPLVWEELSPDHYRCYIVGALNWRCESYGNDKWILQYSVPGYCDQLIPGEWDTHQDAKAAADAHHTAHVLSMLSPYPEVTA